VRDTERGIMLRSLDSSSCDVCPEPAVEVLAIHGSGRTDLLRAVCPAHLEAALRGARMLAPERRPGSSDTGARIAPLGSKD
jgi:hypothetical protein